MESSAMSQATSRRHARGLPRFSAGHPLSVWREVTRVSCAWTGFPFSAAGLCALNGQDDVLAAEGSF